MIHLNWTLSNKDNLQIWAKHGCGTKCSHQQSPQLTDSCVRVATSKIFPCALQQEKKPQTSDTWNSIFRERGRMWISLWYAIECLEKKQWLHMKCHIALMFCGTNLADLHVCPRTDINGACTTQNPNSVKPPANASICSHSRYVCSAWACLLNLCTSYNIK